MTGTSTIGAFSEEQAAKLSNVSLNQLRRWDSDGFFRPSLSDEKRSPYGRVYSFRDIVSLRILHDLRNVKKLPLQHLREVSQRLSHLGDAKWTSTTLYVLGKRVVFKAPDTKLRQEVVSGQRVFDIPLRVVIASTRKAVQELNQRDDQIGKVLRGRFVSQNEPVIAGTRITVAAIRGFAKAGYSVDQIIREYPDLRAADVEAAVTYNADALAA